MDGISPSESAVGFMGIISFQGKIQIPRAIRLDGGRLLQQTRFTHTNETHRSGGQSVVIPYGHVALKIFESKYAADGIRERSLVKEIAKRIRMRVVSPLLGSGMLNDVPMLAYPLMWGDFINLAEVFHQNKRAWDLLSYVQRAGEGLEHLHSVGVVHGDIKPDNILVGEKGEVFLSDLSFASVRGKYRGKPGGTMGYCTEQRHASNKGMCSKLDDWFGLAVSAMVMLTGCPPNENGKHDQVMRWARQALAKRQQFSEEENQGLLRMLQALALTFSPYPPPGYPPEELSKWFNQGVLTAQGRALVVGVNLAPIFSQGHTTRAAPA